MSMGAIVSMAIILTVVVGGFIFFLVKAIRKERNG
ncbi:MAG: MetS family NSS transporter small subunit [Bacteroidota bacterium]